MTNEVIFILYAVGIEGTPHHGVRKDVDTGLHTLEGCLQSLNLEFTTNILNASLAFEECEWYVESSDGRTWTAVGEWPSDSHSIEDMFKLVEGES